MTQPVEAAATRSAWQEIAHENPPLKWLLETLRAEAREWADEKSTRYAPLSYGDPTNSVYWVAAALIEEAAALQASDQPASQGHETKKIGSNKRLNCSGDLLRRVEEYWKRNNHKSKIEAAHLKGDGHVRVEWNDGEEWGPYHIPLAELYGTSTSDQPASQWLDIASAPKRTWVLVFDEELGVVIEARQSSPNIWRSYGPAGPNKCKPKCWQPMPAPPTPPEPAR